MQLTPQGVIQPHRIDIQTLLIMGQQIHLITDRADQVITDQQVLPITGHLALAIIDQQCLADRILEDIVLQAEVQEAVILVRQVEVLEAAVSVLLAEVLEDPQEVALEDPEEEGGINSPFFYPKFSVSPFI